MHKMMGLLSEPVRDDERPLGEAVLRGCKDSSR